MRCCNSSLTRRRALGALAAWSAVPVLAARAAQPLPVMLYKNPQCDCCEAYGAYLQRNGFAVTIQPSNDLILINRQHGVPEVLDGCHTSLIGEYVVIGHMPIVAIRKLLAEKPDMIGISLPGMPNGTPGMGDDPTAHFTVYAITRGDATPPVYVVT